VLNSGIISSVSECIYCS